LRSLSCVEEIFSENLFACALICVARLDVMRRALPARETRKYIRRLGIGKMETQALGFVLERSPRRQSHLEHSIVPVQRISNPCATSLIETWEALKSQGGMVVGQHFPSRRFASALPNILLLEKIERLRDFRIRVAGFGMLCFYGFDPSGRRLAELYSGEKHRARYEALSRVLRGRPNLSLSRLCHDGQMVLQREIVCLPVLASDARTPLVLVASFWNRRWLN
jgi:hypothetical protein